MSSKDCRTSPKGGVCIPTICLDTHTETDRDDTTFNNKLDQDFNLPEDHTFGANDAYFLSWMSLLNSHKKFIIAAALLSQCDDGYRRAMSLLLHEENNKNEELVKELHSKANNFDFIQNLQPSDKNVIVQLKELIPHLDSHSNRKHSNKFLRRRSIPLVFENKSETDLRNCVVNPFHQKDETTLEVPFGPDPISNGFPSIKRKYLQLVSKIVSSSLPSTRDLLIQETNYVGDIPLNELVVQTSVGQLLLMTLLHLAFTEDDRKWLLSSIRREHKITLSDETQISSDINSALYEILLSKLVECLLDIGSDVSYVMQCITSDHLGSSLSHSLTSSGFLSGCCGSDSQYDLLLDNMNSSSIMAASASESRPHYGTLLTVPSSDTKCLHIPYITSCPQSSGLSAHSPPRRLSDVFSSPGFLNRSSKNPPTRSENEAGKKKNFSSEFKLNTISNTCYSNIPESEVSLPLCIHTQSTEVTKDYILTAGLDYQKRPSASTLSDTSSISSGNLDLQVCCSRSSGPMVTPMSSEPIPNHEELVSSYYSPNFVSNLLPHPWQRAGPEEAVSNHVLSFYENDCKCLSNPVANLQRHPSEGFHNFNKKIGLGEQALIPPSTGEYGFCFDKNVLTTESPSSNMFLSPLSGMSAVPMWLKTLRLHKYAYLFEKLTYDEMMNITEDWLKQQNITQGARNKILLNIDRLKQRPLALAHIEKCLTDLPSSGPVFQATLRSCLMELRAVLQTPLKMSTTTVTDEFIDQGINGNQGYLQSSSQKPDFHLDNVSDECFYEFGHTTTNHTASPDVYEKMCASHMIYAKSANLSHGQEFTRTIDYSQLTDQIINCLTKVCSHLLVNQTPELNCCEEFLQIMEIIMNHYAFNLKQKKLISSWRHRMLAVHGHCLPNHTHHHYFSSRQISRPNRFDHHRPIQRCPTFLEYPNESSNNVLMLPFVEMSQHVNQDSSKQTLDPPINCNHRRHSVPVNQTQTVFAPVKPSQRRRMPSPNPAFISNHHVTVIHPNASSLTYSSQQLPPQKHSPLQVSSDIDLTCFSNLLSRPRFHSPSRFDSLMMSCPRRTLLPPATAPATRMPSPSDVNRHGYCFTDWSPSVPTHGFSNLAPSTIYPGVSNLSTSPFHDSSATGSESLGHYCYSTHKPDLSSFSLPVNSHHPLESDKDWIHLSIDSRHQRMNSVCFGFI